VLAESIKNLDLPDGFISFSGVKRLGTGRTFKTVLSDESGKEIAVGLFHENDLELGDTVRVKIIGESDKMYQVYYNSTSQSHGFVSANPIWVPKDMVAVITGRVIRVVVDGRLTALKCEHCRFVLVMAIRPLMTLAVCSKCKRVDHIV
jgi:hypothetical protein